MIPIVGFWSLGSKHAYYRKRGRERDVVHPFPPKKKEGEKNLGIFWLKFFFPTFFTLGNNGHETMVIQVS